MGKTDGKVTLSTKLDTSGIKIGAKSIKRILATTGKAVAVLSAATAAAIVSLTKEATAAYADYEQLTGGVETLFKASADKVKQYADNAFYTVGISANEYMSTVTSFSASLISSLGGDTEKAADVANTALVDMADNANKMGSSLESVQNAYQGFAKQQYTLLDNLKLGYGGTKTEMERLLKDAEAFSGVKYDINNLGDVYEAVHQIQVKLDIAGTTAKEAEKTITGSANMTKAAWKNVLVAISGGGDLDKAINNLVYSISEYFDNIVPVVERSLSGVGQLVERIGPKLVETISKALIQAFPMLLASVYKMVIGLAKGIALGIQALFTGGTETLEKQCENIKQAADNQKELKEEVIDTGKALKKSIAGFDEINTLGSGADQSSVSYDVNIPGLSEGDGTVDAGIIPQIEKNLSELMLVVGWAATAIGVILLFTGNVAWGIGFIIFGAVNLGVAEQSLAGDTVSQTTADALTLLMGVVAGAMVAIGIILLMVGSTALGIGFIAVGAVFLGVGAYQIAAFSSEPIESMLLYIEAIAGGAMLALGIMLLYFGVNKPLAIGLIVAGAAILAVAVAQIVAGAVSEEVAAWIYGITAIVSTALLVIGIIMLCTGQITPLSIGLVVAGAAGLASVVAINWNSIVEALQGPIGKITAIVSAALLVLGIILLFVPGAQGLGLGLLIAGAAGLATVVAFNWNSIVDSIKDVWQKIKDFWNKHIAQVFTGKFWIDLAKKCGNGLIAGFEGAINGIISLFETMINWVVGGLNKISFDVPDWVPLIGGKKFGFNIPEAKFDRVSIPRLARGAVIPPNKEFMAVLGDQKHGTNIEAPLTTIQEAVALVMQDQTSAILAGFEASVGVQREILEAVLGIQIGDDVIGNAVARYSRKQAVIRGGAL